MGGIAVIVALVLLAIMFVFLDIMCFAIHGKPNKSNFMLFIVLNSITALVIVAIITTIMKLI